MTSPRSAPPPEHAVELRLWSLASGDDLRTVRAELARELIGRRLADSQLCERITLVVTELASNALRHGRPPVRVRLLRTPGELILVVSDGDPAGEPRSSESDGLVAGGRGLLIVGSFADDLSWHADGLGKSVWASFRTAPAARPEPG